MHCFQETTSDCYTKRMLEGALPTGRNDMGYMIIITGAPQSEGNQSTYINKTKAILVVIALQEREVPHIFYSHGIACVKLTRLILQ